MPRYFSMHAASMCCCEPETAVPSPASLLPAPCRLAMPNVPAAPTHSLSLQAHANTDSSMYIPGYVTLHQHTHKGWWRNSWQACCSAAAAVQWKGYSSSMQNTACAIPNPPPLPRPTAAAFCQHWLPQSAMSRIDVNTCVDWELLS
jgi:hypothetical protein